jgi:hypothetical protein
MMIDDQMTKNPLPANTHQAVKPWNGGKGSK